MANDAEDGPLKWAEGVVATPCGDIHVKVRRDSDFETSVEVEMSEEIGDADCEACCDAD